MAFDLDDTLFNATWLSNKARLGGLQKMIKLGLNVNIKDAFNILEKIVEKFGSNYSKHFDELLNYLQVNGQIKIDQYQIPKYIAAGVWGYHSVKEKYLKPFKDVITTLKKLKNEGLITAIFSDGLDIKQWEKILRLQIHSYLDYVFISEKLEYKKPDSKFFEFCLNKIGIDPSECIYIGDRLDKDILPAYKMEMIPILIHRKGKYDPNINKNENYLNIINQIPKSGYYEIYKLTEVIKIIKKLNN